MLFVSNNEHKPALDDIMADLNKDIRLAVDTGKVVLGARELMKAVNGKHAKLVIVASKGKADTVSDVMHACKVGEVKAIRFEGNSMDLGAICGKPYSVNGLAVLEAGNSNILKEEYA